MGGWAVGRGHRAGLDGGWAVGRGRRREGVCVHTADSPRCAAEGDTPV